MNDFINDKIYKLKQKKILNPEIDLRILLNHAKIIKRNIILSTFKIEQINVNFFNLLFNRRLNNEPVSKIINKKSFWKDDFYVDQFVLDPRPETEGIIEESLSIINDKKAKLKILDIGTGSGALAISLAREFNNSKILAIDVSRKAIEVAKKNIFMTNMEKKIELKQTTIDSINDSFDLVVSNPPYLSKKDLKQVSKEIINFEPIVALYGGDDGLNFYREFANKIPNNIKKKGYLILEIGDKQLEACMKIFNSSSLSLLKKKQDLQKKDRILVFSKI